MSARLITCALLALALVAAAQAGGDADLTAAVADVNQDVAESRVWLQNAGYTANNTSPDLRWKDGHLAAISAMQRTAGLVSAWRYLYRQRWGLPLPTGGTALECAIKSVEMRAGLCAGSAFVMQEILARVGYTTRKVDAWYSGGGHALVEVWFGGAWHLYDPTFGRWWVAPGGCWAEPADAATIAAARGGAWEVSDHGHLYTLITRRLGLANGWGWDWWNRDPLTVQTGATVLYSR